jgi:hypothetical protein
MPQCRLTRFSAQEQQSCSPTAVTREVDVAVVATWGHVTLWHGRARIADGALQGQGTDAPTAHQCCWRRPGKHHHLYILPLTVARTLDISQSPLKTTSQTMAAH